MKNNIRSHQALVVASCMVIMEFMESRLDQDYPLHFSALVYSVMAWIGMHGLDRQKTDRNK